MMLTLLLWTETIPPKFPGFTAERLIYARNVPNGGIVSEDGNYWFIPDAKQIYIRHDRNGNESLNGEQIWVALDQSGRRPRMYTSTMSQQFRGYNSAQGSSMQIFNGDAGAFPLAANEKDQLLINTRWHSYDSKLRFDGVSVVRYRQRGPNPNFDAMFSTDGHGRFEVLACKPASIGWQLLVGYRTKVSDRTIRIWSYTFSNGTLTRMPSTAAFGKLPSTVIVPITLNKTSFQQFNFQYDAFSRRFSFYNDSRRRVELDLVTGRRKIWTASNVLPEVNFCYLGGQRYGATFNSSKSCLGKVLVYIGDWIDTGATRIVAVSGSGNYALVEGKQGDMWMMKRVAGPAKTR